MQYRIFAIPAVGAPDQEEELNRFLRSKKIIAVQKSLETIGGAPCWCFCVEYLEGGVPSSRRDGFSSRSRRVDYKEALSEDDFAVYARLRDVRKELAAAEAVPVYTICTNEQLAVIAQKRPGSLVELKTIEGLGDAKVAKYRTH